MRILILHLSDIHADEKNNACLGRDGLVVDAVKNMEYEGLDAAIVAISGDIANTGIETEYYAAWEFNEKVIKGLESNLAGHNGAENVPVYCVAVPGNHDCHIPKDSAVRDTLIGNLPNDLTDSVIRTCTQVQEYFFQFRDTFTGDGIIANSEGVKNKLYYEYLFTVGSEKIHFMCYNTAWVSRITEKQGELSFPVEAFSQHKSESDVTVALLHHPYNWLKADNARQLRTRIESHVDIVLTGHEHDSTSRRSQSSTGERNTYIEGAVFQGNKTDMSGFNVLEIDTKRADGPKQKFCQFIWDGTRYILGPGTCYEQDGTTVLWESFQVGRMRQREQFRLNDEMKRWLADPGVTLQHRGLDHLALADVFVYPDLLELTFISTSTPRKIKSVDVSNLAGECKYLFLAGDDQSGKTSLCKMLFESMRANGYVPIYLSGYDVPQLKTGEKTFKYLEKVYEKQYDRNTLDAYKQLDRDKRVIIVDNFHKLSMQGTTRRDFVTALTQFAGYVILIGDELTLSVNEMADPACISNDNAPFSFFAIQPMGYRLRNMLVDKWLLLGSVADPESREFTQKLHRISNTLDTLIGQNYIPAYPVYVLAVLQADESGTHLDVKAANHAYFYELLIRNALARSGNNQQYEVSMAYLGYMAYTFFDQRISGADPTTIMGIHNNYVNLYEINLNLKNLIAEFTQNLLLNCHEEIISFKYPYIYYYFVAAYLRDHIGEPKVQQQIIYMSQKLHVTQYANIMLFLCHLSKDPFIIEKMLEVANECYSATVPAQLGDDVAFLNTMRNETENLTLEDESAKKARQRIMDALDENTDASKDKDNHLDLPEEPLESSANALDPITQLNASLKTLQILGQILKNFLGHITGQDKFRIASACYGLGMRTLGQMLGFLEQDQEALCRLLAKVLQHQNPSWAPEYLEKRARESIVNMASLFSFVLIRRTSIAVGSPMLETTYAKIAAQNNSTSTKLINTSLSLDHKGGFPDKEIIGLADALKSNPLAYGLLRYLVYEHLCLFPVDFRKTQRICDALNISDKRVLASHSSRKLVK